MVDLKNLKSHVSFLYSWCLVNDGLISNFRCQLFSHKATLGFLPLLARLPCCKHDVAQSVTVYLILCILSSFLTNIISLNIKLCQAALWAPWSWSDALEWHCFASLFCLAWKISMPSWNISQNLKRGRAGQEQREEVKSILWAFLVLPQYFTHCHQS